MNSPLDESAGQEEDLTMTYSPITPEEWTEIERIAADGPAPDRVTVTTTPDVHAATEALIVAASRWADCEGDGMLVIRLRQAVLNLRLAMKEGEAF